MNLSADEIVSLDSERAAPAHRRAAGGVPLALVTDSEDLRRTFDRVFPSTEGSAELTFRIQVHHQPCDLQFDEPAFFGRDGFAAALFGDREFLSFDLARREILGYFSFITASDPAFWEQRALPIALGIAGPEVGIVPVHCATVVHRGQGVLISGLSGAGKSTLTAALAEAGLEIVADDWTFVTARDRLRAFGMKTPLKLMPDCIRFFPRLAKHTTHITLNGEEAYEIDCQREFGAPMRSECEPQALVLLERADGASQFARVAPSEALDALYESLEPIPETLAASRRNRDQVLDAVSRLDCWRFRAGGTPQRSARELIEFLDRSLQ